MNPYLQFYRLNIVFLTAINAVCLMLFSLVPSVIAIVIFKLFGNLCVLALSSLFTSRYSYYFANLGYSANRMYLVITAVEIVVLVLVLSSFKLIL